MMQLNSFYTDDNGQIFFSRQQASDFAKEIAGDFNPIHDQDSKMFCVPGDLLFACVLQRFGLSQKMNFTFSGMVGENQKLNLQKVSDNHIVISDDNNKEYLTIEYSGDVTHDTQLIESLTRSYVEFSGKTFPHILVPLMTDNNVMINPSRPLVIYQSMLIEMDEFDISNPVLELTHTQLDVNGKRGSASVEFSVLADGKQVGRGVKTMVLSGLREFDAEQIKQLVSGYNARKQRYLTQA